MTAELSDAELERYARQIVLPQLGGVGQRRLKAARAAVVGAGGIGSAVIPSLTGAGVGRLTIIDGDVVDSSNLHRQTLFRDADVGLPKAELAAAFARERNPHVDVSAASERVDETNAERLLADHDLIIDGSDNFATRLLVSDTAVQLRIPLVSAAALQFQGQAGLWRARPCYRCFVGDAFDADDCDNCAELGVVGALTAIVGAYAALLAIRALAGVGPDDSGKLHLFDAMAMTWRTMAIPADPGCKACAQTSA